MVVGKTPKSVLATQGINGWINTIKHFFQPCTSNLLMELIATRGGGGGRHKFTWLFKK